MNQLSEHFNLAELTATTTGLDNKPTIPQLENLMQLANQLEVVRTLCGNRPITISSGFRSKEVNLAVGGKNTSTHLTGLAVDFNVAGMSVNQVCTIINNSKLQFDQVIDEFRNGKKWVHLSFDPPLRRQWVIIVGGVAHIIRPPVK